MAENNLNSRQERYCQEYTADPKRNQTRAAVRAGYSEKSARINASILMKNPNILRRIKELEREALEEAGYSIEALKPLIMRQLAAQATVDASDLAHVVYKDDERRRAALEQIAEANGGQGSIDFGEPLIYIKPTSEWTAEERAAVKAIRPTKEGIEIVMHDKQGALKALAEITGIVKSGVDVTLSISDSIAEARRRARGAAPGPDMGVGEAGDHAARWAGLDVGAQKDEQHEHCETHNGSRAYGPGEETE
ncbi:MAG: terminase small subunit [Synergistaceae bacterium]|jgi:phage terminase small subunit|nr:terminase small subunit [Synergistaceae bacterium]